MSSYTQPAPSLPQSPRANRTMLLPLDTTSTFPRQPSLTPSSSSETLGSQSQNQTPNTRRHRNADSLIFINATIPLSPAPSSTTSDESSSEALLQGLVPRRRNGLARLFCCFGREERARRRVLRETQFEKVGEKAHWSEY